MSQINKIIRELWRATYKGNDIDYIEIKTDDIDEPMGADKKRVCNYRVIMVNSFLLLYAPNEQYLFLMSQIWLY